MTQLRKRMIEDLQLRGMSERTIGMYTRAVRQLAPWNIYSTEQAEHYHKSPDKITEEELRQYFLYNKNVRKWSRTASTISLCGIKFFFTYTLQRDWPTIELVRPQPEKKLPTILSNEWLLNQKELLLPMPYFMVTFTIPEPLRKVIRRHQKTLLNILFRSSAESLQILAQDKRFVGGKIGMVGVLHTWSRALIYHPHIHYLLPGGGLTDNHRKWRRAKEKFLMRVEPLSIIFRGKFRDAVKKSNLFDQIPKNVWHKQ